MDSRFAFRNLCTVLLGVLPLALTALPAQANSSTLLDSLIRNTAKVADDVPLRQADEIAAELTRSRTARDTIDAELSRSGKIYDGMNAAEKASIRSTEVLNLLRQATRRLDPDAVRAIEGLDDASRESALILARGGEQVSRALPDLAARSRLLREGGPETVAAAGLHGQDLAHAAVRVNEAINGGGLVLRQGQRAITLADFGRVMNLHGGASWSFWQQYVQPHWKLWAASGALAAYLANPEYFQDAAGRMTEKGFKHLTEFAGEAAAAAIRGIGAGTGAAVDEVGTAVRDTYFSGWRGLQAIIGTLLLLVIVSRIVPSIGRVWLRPLEWLRRLRQRSRVREGTKG